MIVTEGNIWEYPAHYTCVPVNKVIKDNGELVMGAGLARQAKEMYPHIPKRFGQLMRQHNGKVCYDDITKLIAFPTKNHWKDDSDLLLIERSAKQLHRLCYSLGNPEYIITLPTVGCGNGGLMWQQVKPVLSANLPEDNFVVVLRNG